MTEIEDLARRIQERHGIDNFGAALTIVNTYVDQVVGDHELWDEDARRLTDDGVHVISEAVRQATEQGLVGTHAQRLLDAIAEEAIQVRESVERRDALVRAAMKTELTRDQIAAAAGLSVPRLYQIRDGRR